MAAIQRPPHVAECFCEPFPQYSTPPNKMIVYKTYTQPTIAKKPEKGFSTSVPKCVIHKSKNFTFLKILSPNVHLL